MSCDDVSWSGSLCCLCITVQSICALTLTCSMLRSISSSGTSGMICHVVWFSHAWWPAVQGFLILQ